MRRIWVTWDSTVRSATYSRSAMAPFDSPYRWLREVKRRVLELSVLGPLQVVEDGVDVTPRGDLQRRLLSLLLLEAGQPVSADRLADGLWGESLPANHTAALQTQMFRLRKRVPSLPLDRAAGGYVADVDGCRLDVRQFERLVTGGFACRDHDPAAALAMLDEALALWRGDPFADLDADGALAAVSRLGELRLRALDERAEILLARGEPSELIADLEARAITHPTRELTHLQLVRALAGGGRTVDALRALDRFRRTLGDELGVEPSPEFRAVHTALLIGSDDAQPVGSRLRGRPVPRYSTAIVGREGAATELIGLATRERLVTVVGTGGVGKTRMVAHVAALLGERFESGVAWCDLASSSPANVLDSVAAQLGVQTLAGEDPIERIVAGVGDAPLLVVLDNCEHVIDQAATLAHHVVRGTARAHVIATSRERLAVDGEHLLPLAPLPVGDDGEDAAAVDLFHQRASAMHAGIVDDAASRDQVAELCRRLGGLPLAIELAAAQLHAVDLDTIVREITRSLDLLSGHRTSDRHRSLAAAMQWSYDLLSAEERRCFTWLSVFRAPFTVEGAAAVLDCPATVAAARVRALVERSLLQRSEARWLMLEPLRQFAAETWPSGSRAVDRDGALERHARYQVARSQDLSRQLRTADPAPAMLAFDQEMPDLRATYGHLVERGEVDALFDLAYAVRDYGMCRPRNEVIAWGLAPAELAPDDPRAPDMLGYAAQSSWARGDRATFGELTRRAHERSVALRGEGGESVDVCDTLSLYALSTGRLADTVHWCDAALAVIDPTDPLRRAEIEVARTLALSYSGDERALESAERNLASFEAGPSLVARALGWYAAGETYIDRDPQLAMGRLARSVELATAAEASWVAATAGASLASLEVRHGDPHGAADLYRWLLPLWARNGDTSVVWTAMRSIASLLRMTGDHEGAASVLSAVRSTASGHELYGADIERLDALESALRAEMTGDAFEAATRKGRGLEVVELTALGAALVGPVGLNSYQRGPAGSMPRAALPTDSWVRASLAGWKPPQRTSR